MKIVYIGVMASGKDEGIDFAFGKYEYVGINPGWGDIEGRIKAIPFDPDIVFIQIQGDRIGNRSTVDTLGPFCKQWKEKGAFVINWTGDIRYGLPAWMVKFAPYVNITAFSNQRDLNAFSGPKAYLQLGIDPVNYNTDGVVQSDYDIVFMANNFGPNHFPLSSFRKECADALRAEFGNRFGLFGNGWKHANGNLNVQGSDVAHWQQKEATYYRGCKIAVSISHYQVERYTSDRLLRALGCGAFTLVHNYAGIEKEFTPGKHLVTFDKKSDLIRLCHEWIDKEERKKIGQAAGRLIAEKFTFELMVENIIKLKG